MTKKNKTNQETPEIPMMNAPLERAKDKFVATIVVGLTPDGVLDLETDMSSYPHMQHLLNRASFELFIHENKSERSREAEVQSA